jgi:hypothetical protein
MSLNGRNNDDNMANKSPPTPCHAISCAHTQRQNEEINQQITPPTFFYLLLSAIVTMKRDKECGGRQLALPLQMTSIFHVNDRHERLSRSRPLAYTHSLIENHRRTRERK